MEPISLDKAIHILNAKKVSAFAITDAKKIFCINNKNTLYKFLQRLEKRNIVERILPGKYIFSLKDIPDFFLANFLNTSSYISLESALSFYGILAQFPYTITSVTVDKPKRIIFREKEYEFSHINPKYFFGFIKRNNFLIASPEKALLDELYFAAKNLRKVDIKELDLSKIDKLRLKKMSQDYKLIPLKILLDKIL